MFGINTYHIKKYKRRRNKYKNVSDVYTDMKTTYLGVKSKEERAKIKYELKDIIADSDRIAGLTLVLTLAYNLIKDMISASVEYYIINKDYPNQIITNEIAKKVSEDGKNSILFFIVVIIVIIGLVIIYIMNNYRLSKLYLDVIDDIEENNIGKIKNRDKILLDMYSKFYSKHLFWNPEKLYENFEISKQKFNNGLVKLENEKSIIKITENEFIISIKGINYIEDQFNINEHLRAENKILKVKELLDINNLA